MIGKLLSLLSPFRRLIANRRYRYALYGLGGIFFLLLLGFALGNASPERSGGLINANAVAVIIRPQNDSKESGKAMIEEISKQAIVNFEISGHTGEQQAILIYNGSCDAIGAPKYPMSSLTDGKSETVLGGTLEQLKSELPLAMAIHSDESGSSAIVACGDIRY